VGKWYTNPFPSLYFSTLVLDWAQNYIIFRNAEIFEIKIKILKEFFLEIFFSKMFLLKENEKIFLEKH
jgi:hypothetical protein